MKTLPQIYYYDHIHRVTINLPGPDRLMVIIFTNALRMSVGTFVLKTYTHAATLKQNHPLNRNMGPVGSLSLQDLLLTYEADQQSLPVVTTFFTSKLK